MIGVVVITHGIIGKEMIRVAKSIMKQDYPFASVSVEHDESTEKTRSKIEAAMQEVSSQEGILLMTDMFGGTPTNICLSFLKEKQCEVITGVNLPMLLKMASVPQNQSLVDAAKFIQDYGQKHISRAYDVLKGGSSANP